MENSKIDQILTALGMFHVAVSKLEALDVPISDKIKRASGISTLIALIASEIAEKNGSFKITSRVPTKSEKLKP